MSHKKVTVISLLALVLLLAISGVAQADPPAPGEEPPDGSSLNETLNFNNLGTIMSGRNDADGTDDGPDDQNPDDEKEEPEEDEDGVDDEAKQHPVATALAEYFEVPYEDVMGLHEAGNGFGTITKAFFFADKFDPPLTPQELLEKAHGTGWGNVLKEGDIHPGSVGNGGANSNRPDHAGRPDDNPAKDGPPGQIKKDDEVGDTSAGPSGLVGPGGNNGNNGRNNGNPGNNGNGNGNGKGVNGRPNDNGGGPGNSGNNGNNGNNGNGRGNGRGNK